MHPQITPITIATGVTICLMALAMAHTTLKAALNVHHIERPAHVEAW